MQKHRSKAAMTALLAVALAALGLAGTAQAKLTGAEQHAIAARPTPDDRFEEGEGALRRVIALQGMIGVRHIAQIRLAD